jgi:competence protein ComEC
MFTKLIVVFSLLVIFIVRYNSFVDEEISYWKGEALVDLPVEICDFPDIRYDYVNYLVCYQDYRFLVRGEIYEQFDYGDIISLSGVLEAPYNSNYANYLLQFGVRQIVNKPRIELLTKKQCLSVYCFIWEVKKTLLASFYDDYHEPFASLAAGLVVGYRGGLNQEWNDKFKELGLTHILAVSGSNVALWIYLGNIFLFFLPRFWRMVLLIIFLCFFVILVGGPAVTRAVMMGICFLVAKEFGFSLSSLKVLFFVGFLMILYRPTILFFDLGFHLSFVATMGIIVFVPFFTKNKIPEYFAVILSAQIATLPLIYLYFPNNFLLSLLSNFLLGWIIPFLTFFSLISLFLPGVVFINSLLMKVFLVIVDRLTLLPSIL